MAEYIIEPSRNVLKINTFGALSYADIVALIEQHGSSVSRNMLWDLRFADAIRITSQETQSLPHIVKKFMVNRETGGKTAIVCSCDCNFGLVNMYAAFAEIAELPCTIRPFRDNEAALEWLA